MVSLSVGGDGKVQFGEEKGQVVFRRTGNIDVDLIVFYKAKGSAKAGTDYKALPGTVTIPAGATQIKVKIKGLDDPANTSKLKLKIMLLPPSDGSYLPINTDPVKVTILGAG